MLLSENTTSVICKGLNLFKVLHNGKVQQLIAYLSHKDVATVTELKKHLNLGHAVTSLSLQRMREVGIVTRRKRGRFCYYSLNEQRIQSVLHLLKTF